MPLTPQDIESRTFDVRKRGYDKTQVDRFLGEIANAYRMVIEGGAEAVGPRQESVPAADAPVRRPLLHDPASAAAPHAARLTPDGSASAASDPPGPSSPADPSAAPAPHPAAPPLSTPHEPFARLGSEVAAVLDSAQEQADRIRADAESRAARLRTETEAWSQRVTSDAEQYAVARRQEADGDRQEAGRLLHQAKERTAAAEWAQQEAQRRLAEVDQQVVAQLDDAARDADQILKQAERAARARVEGILADADRRLEEAADALGAGDSSGGRKVPRAERRRPPTSPVRGGRRRTDPPVIDLVREHDPIIDLVEGRPLTGRAGSEAPLYPVADHVPAGADQGDQRRDRTRTGADRRSGSGTGGGGSHDPLTALLSDAVGQAGEPSGDHEGPGSDQT